MSVNIFLANPRGFCAGVTRAITTVENALKNLVAQSMLSMKLFIINLSLMILKIKEQFSLIIFLIFQKMPMLFFQLTAFLKRWKMKQMIVI